MSPQITRIIYGLCAIAFVVIVARAYLNVKGTDALQPTVPQSQVQSYAREQLNSVQEQSFADSIEVCGIIFETSEGALGTSFQSDGDEATCDLSYFDEPGMVPVASFHTHGSFSRDYDSEVPSITDIQSDMSSGIDGYIATPGGRFWWVDHESGIARLVCAGCLKQDPNYRPCAGDLIEQNYTIDRLAERFRKPDPSC